MVDSSGNNIINPNISKDKKASLFSLLQDVLPAENLNLEFITDKIIQSVDGVVLWNQCSKRFAPSTKGYYDKGKMKNEFKILSKGEKETHSNFLERVKIKANELDREGIELKPHVKAWTLLRGLRSECFNIPIISIMQDEGNGDYGAWIKDGDLKHTLDKAESRISTKLQQQQC